MNMSMDMELKAAVPGRETRERMSAMLVAAAVTFLVFAAINVGFTPHATDLANHVFAGTIVAL